MKTALLAALWVLALLPLRAEDWTTSDGKTYKNVQVLSHNAAYVTILYQDGGGRIRLSTLRPDLQKRFGYNPAKAPVIIAATHAADQRDKEALAREQSRIRAEQAQRDKAVADAVATAFFAPPSTADGANPAAVTTNSPPSGDAAAVTPPAIASEPPTEIDDGDYDDYGDYGGYDGYGDYGGYGYGYGHGYHGSRGSSGGWGNHSAMGAFTHR